METSRTRKLKDFQNPLLRVDLSGLDRINLFEEMVKRLPDEAALVDGKTILTYSDVNRRANQIGRAILEISATPGEQVAALAGISPEMALMTMAVMKVRKVLVGLSPGQPVQHLENLIKNAEVGILVCCDESRPLAEQLAGKLGLLLLDIDDLSDFQDDNLGLAYHPNDLTSIIYTSGSTGEPKGVMSDHMVSMHGLGVHATTGLDETMRFLSIYHFSYANGVSGPFKSWLLGGTYHPFDLNKHGLTEMIKRMKQEQITVYQSPPSLFRNIVRQIKPAELSSIRWVHLGGEPVLARDFEMFKEKFPPPCQFFNNYGSSEVGSMARNVLGHLDVLEDEIVPLGHKTARMTLTIQDEDGNLVDQGIVGEMVVQSKYVVKAYWKNPELTSKKIQPVEGSDEKIIHTGDLVYQRPDGRYVYVGRKDSMVKIRGSRVHTLEVEATLARIRGVDEAVIRVANTPLGDSRLIAFIQPADAANLTADKIRHALSERLPAQMIPGQIVFLNQFPRTTSGKIDRQSLPDVGRSRPQLSNEAIPASGLLEEKLSVIWEQVLDLEHIGVTDNFFDLGGDSLMAVELFIEIEKLFGKNLPISLLLEAGSIRQQARMLASSREQNPWQPVVTFNQLGSQTPLFCFAGKGGNPIRFRHLALQLGDNQPIFFLQSRGLSGDESPLTSVEDIAADFVQEIQRVRPDGPYRLLGSSFGGKVAYQVGYLLKKAGQNVEFVMMLDTGAPDCPASIDSRSWFGELWEYLSKHWHSLREGNPSERRAYLKYYLDLVPLYLRKWLWKVQEKREARRRTQSLPDAYKKVEEANVAASRKFEPSPFPGLVILLRAKQKPNGNEEELSLGWSKYEIGTLIIHPVDGNHGNLLMPPFVNQVAKILEKYNDDG